MAHLIVESGSDRASVEIGRDEKIVIGRDPKAGLRLRDQASSRRHFLIVERAGRFYLKDLGSQNGTRLNGETVEKARLHFGDKIQVGATVMRFAENGAAASTENPQGDAANGSAASEPAGRESESETPGESGSGGGLVGRELCGYRFDKRLGRGSMGTVYVATQLSLERTVALKVLSPELLKKPSFIEMFRSEARAAGQLNHPNIIQVYDVLEYKGIHFYSMEFAEGGSVQDLIEAGGYLEPQKALRIIKDACAALDYAEKKQLVHRDIKPDNLFLNADGTAKIGDLGLAHSTAEGGEQVAGVFGTPHYIAPEQALGRSIDHRADIYALGASFYRMVTGQTPYRGRDVKEIIRRHVKEQPPYAAERPADVPESVAFPQVPPMIADIIYKMMAKNPEERYSSAAEIIPELDRALTRLEMSTRRAAAGGLAGGKRSSGYRPQTQQENDAGASQSSDPRKKAWVALAAGGGAFLLLIGLVVLASVLLTSPEEEDEQEPLAGEQVEPQESRGEIIFEDEETPDEPDRGEEEVSEEEKEEDSGPTAAQIRQERARLIEEIRTEVREILEEHDFSRRALSEAGVLQAVHDELNELAERYAFEEVFLYAAETADSERAEEQEIVSRNPARRIFEHFDEILAEIEPLLETHESEFETVEQEVAAALGEEHFGRAVELYEAYARQYWYDHRPREARLLEGSSEVIGELHDFVEEFAPSEVRLVGFPGALRVMERPDGKLWQLRSDFGGRFLEQMRAMDKAMRADRQIADFDERRAQLQPFEEFFLDVLETWKLNNAEFVVTEEGRHYYINAEAADRVNAVRYRIRQINEAELEQLQGAFVAIRDGIRNGFETARQAVYELDFEGARAPFEALRAMPQYTELEGEDREAFVILRDIMRAKEAQLDRAEAGFHAIVTGLQARLPLPILRPRSLREDEEISGGPTRATIVEARPEALTLRGRTERQPRSWGVLIELEEREDDVDRVELEHFYEVLDRAINLQETENPELLLNISALLLELGVAERLVATEHGRAGLIERVMDSSSGQLRGEAREYKAWALIVRVYELFEQGDGRAAQGLLERFKQEYADTAAHEYMTSARGDRILRGERRLEGDEELMDEPEVDPGSDPSGRHSEETYTLPGNE